MPVSAARWEWGARLRQLAALCDAEMAAADKADAEPNLGERALAQQRVQEIRGRRQRAMVLEHEAYERLQREEKACPI